MRWAGLRRELASSHPASTIGLARAGLGTAMALRPMLLPRLLGVAKDSAVSMDWTMRMVGAREIALGLGGLSTSRDRRRSRWLLAQAISDCGDAVALSMALRERKVAALPTVAVVVFAIVGAVVEVAAVAAYRGDPVDPSAASAG